MIFLALHFLYQHKATTFSVYFSQFIIPFPHIDGVLYNILHIPLCNITLSEFFYLFTEY